MGRPRKHPYDLPTLDREIERLRDLRGTIDLWLSDVYRYSKEYEHMYKNKQTVQKELNTLLKIRRKVVLKQQMNSTSNDSDSGQTNNNVGDQATNGTQDNGGSNSVEAIVVSYNTNSCPNHTVSSRVRITLCPNHTLLTPSF